MTLIIAGGLIGFAAAIIERIIRSIRSSDTVTQVVHGIRRHSSLVGVWPGTTPAGQSHDALIDDHRQVLAGEITHDGPTSIIHMTKDGVPYEGRHRDPNEVPDTGDETEITDSVPVGRRHRDNPFRIEVPGDWTPLTGRSRIQAMERTVPIRRSTALYVSREGAPAVATGRVPGYMRAHLAQPLPPRTPPMRPIYALPAGVR